MNPCSIAPCPRKLIPLLTNRHGGRIQLWSQQRLLIEPGERGYRNLARCTIGTGKSASIRSISRLPVIRLNGVNARDMALREYLPTKDQA